MQRWLDQVLERKLAAGDASMGGVGACVNRGHVSKPRRPGATPRQ